MISDEDRERVRAATDLVALVQETVPLQPRNKEFWGCCPFHGEKTPSFHIIPATQVWHCFGCGEGGDCFSYVMKRENLSFPESIRYLADRAGIEIHDDFEGRQRGSKRSRLIEVCEASSQFFHTMLMRGRDDRPRTYFASRHMGGAVCKRYRLGFAPGRGSLVRHLTSLGFTPQEMVDANVAIRRDRGAVADRFYDRVMFPIFDELGRCIAFGGRIMGDGQPKYLNTSETALFHKKRNLYGFNWAKDDIVARAEAIVVEGYTDAIACWEADIKNVVATLGTALTEHHVKTLTRFAKRIVYLFDGDAAGQKAAERAIQFIENDAIDLRCVVLPAGMDPMEFITAEGGGALRALIEDAEPLMDFVFRKLGERSDVSTPGGRTRALEDALRLIYPLRASYMIDAYYQQVADRVGLDVENVRAAAPQIFRAVEREEADRERRAADRERAQARQAHPAGETGAPLPAGVAAPYDEVPLDAYGQVPQAPEPAETAPVQQPVILTELERRALVSERELLTLLTAHPDTRYLRVAHRGHRLGRPAARGDRLGRARHAGGHTSGRRHGRRPCGVPRGRRARLLRPHRATSAHPTEVNIKFLLDTLALFTVRRGSRRPKAGSGRAPGSLRRERRELTIEASQGAARKRALERELEGRGRPVCRDGAARWRRCGLADGGRFVVFSISFAWGIDTCDKVLNPMNQEGRLCA